MENKKKKSIAGWKKVVIGALVTTAIGTGVAVTQLPYFVGEQVIAVIDGDSFKIDNDQTIRLASLNAPENELCYGPEATKALTDKILNKRVILRDLKTDLYGRILAMVYVNGEIVNEYMIKNGFAVTTRQGGIENDKIVAANDYARQNKKGLYGICIQTDPPNPKCPIKGNIDDRNKGKHYLTTRCPDYSKTIIELNEGEQWFCSEAEAKKAGYSESPSCNRNIPNT